MCNKKCQEQTACGGPKMIHSFLHDIRNKLAVGMGKTQFLLRTETYDKAAIDSIESALMRITELVKALQHTTSHEQVSVNEAMETSAPTIFSALEKMYQVRWVVGKLESAEQGAKMSINHSSIIKIMENLTENAVNAGASLLTLTDEVKGNFIISTILDNGKGCCDIQKIGTGWTSRKEQGGSGCGSKNLKEFFISIGGDITWESLNSGGIKVTLKIPIDRDQTSVKKAA